MSLPAGVCKCLFAPPGADPPTQPLPLDAPCSWSSAGAAARLGRDAGELRRQRARSTPFSLSHTAISQRLTVFGLPADQQLVSIRVANPAHRCTGLVVQRLESPIRRSSEGGHRAQFCKLYGVPPSPATSVYHRHRVRRSRPAFPSRPCRLPARRSLSTSTPRANAASALVSDAGPITFSTVSSQYVLVTKCAEASSCRNAFAVTGAAYVLTDLDVSAASTLFDIGSVNCAGGGAVAAYRLRTGD